MWLWPGGRTSDERFSCGGCARRVSVTAGTIFHGTRTPLTAWFAAPWYVTNQKFDANALGLQRVLGLGSYETAWTIVHKLRHAMVRPDRDLLSGLVEVDETYVGGEEKGVHGRFTEKKAIVATALELHEPRGSGRVRIRQVADVSAASLVPFVCETITPGSTVKTDQWTSYRTITKHGYVHEPTSRKASGDPAHVVMPGGTASPHW